MISKETFVRAMTYVEEHEKITIDAENILGVTVDYDGPLYQGVVMVLNLLHEVLGDTDEWLEYFMYECDFGEDWDENSVEFNGKPIPPITTYEALYDFICQYYEDTPEEVFRTAL